MYDFLVNIYQLLTLKFHEDNILAVGSFYKETIRELLERLLRRGLRRLPLLFRECREYRAISAAICVGSRTNCVTLLLLRRFTPFMRRFSIKLYSPRRSLRQCSPLGTRPMLSTQPYNTTQKPAPLGRGFLPTLLSSRV